MVERAASVAQVKTAKRRRQPAVTEDRILNVAERMFAESGFDAVSTKQLAREAGLTIGALYHHFPGKEAIYDAATRRVFARRSQTPAHLMEAGIEPRERLVRLVAHFVEALSVDRNFALLLRRELLDPRGEGAPGYLDFFRRNIALFKGSFRQVAPRADVDKGVATILALSFGFASMKGIYAVAPDVRPSLGTPRRIAEYAVAVLLDGGVAAK